MELDILSKSVEDLVDLEAVQKGCLGRELTHCVPHIEHRPILHNGSQPQLDPIMYRDMFSQARTKGSSQVIVDFSVAGA